MDGHAAGIKSGRPSVWTRRHLMGGIRWRTRTGDPWRDVPERYGLWGRGHALFRCWQRDGAWARIVTRLQAEAGAAGGDRARVLRRALCIRFTVQQSALAARFRVPKGAFVGRQPHPTCR
ncbi:transposase [Streptomyces sp. NPDC057654]|uniref:transposase n=1 Tax=Streptomyces sp. NPDC057654 TaxID=3346196 RepID=UPI0036C1D57C